MQQTNHRYWPSARHFTEAIQCPGICFANGPLRETLPAVDRLGMPLVTSGQFAYVYKLKSRRAGSDFAVRCFRGYLGDRDQRYRAIQNHIQAGPLPCLSDFVYEPQGILVGGQRFPIISMQWIVGPTLDFYLAEMIGRREVLDHLADEWVKLVGALREAGIAHGDLQHGNIIVGGGRLRLVDHDGIFVPEMAGWSSSELGHQHYQHPRRDAEFFDATLDNFSALVIYLSLISLAEQPQLWPEHHDENLLFTKTDFIDPASSSLFAKIKQIGPDHCRLATILEEAAAGEPAAVPYLHDLVSVKSQLPSWMTAPPKIESQTKTREVIQDGTDFQKQDGRWKPWRTRPSTPSLPATPPSSTVQTIFGGPTPAASIAGISDPSQVLRNTPVFAKDLLTGNFLWWYWGIYFCLTVLGLDFFYSILLAVTSLAVISLSYGFVRARELAHANSPANLSLRSPLPATAPISAGISRSVAVAPLTPASSTVPEPVIGNLALSIYHLHNCSWVVQISPRNRIGFRSPSEALTAGFKPCRVCSPSN